MYMQRVSCLILHSLVCVSCENVICTQVLLLDELADSVKQGRAYQSTHPLARNTEGLAKSSLLKECHITGVPAAWFTEEGGREASVARPHGRKSASSKELQEEQQCIKHR